MTWYRDQEEVVAFARDMIAAGVLQGSSGVLEYFEKPYGWGREHDWWEENNRTDDRDLWAQGEVDGWES